MRKGELANGTRVAVGHHACYSGEVDVLLVARFLLEMHLNKRSQLISAGTDIKKEWDLVC